jgi:hypothetical protein
MMVTPRNPMIAQMMGAITSRSADRIATFDMSATPIPPTDSGAVNPGDPGTQAAIDAVMQMEALENLDQVISDLQSQITILNETVTEQADQITRVTAAVKSFKCPDRVLDQTTKDVVATVAICMDQGNCTCDVGNSLRMPGYDDGESSSSQEVMKRE